MPNLRSIFCPFLLLGAGNLTAAAEPQFTLDSNVAFFEGETLSYVVYPPSNFRMVTDEARLDGYSFAFVPDSQTYSSSDVTIGVNYYKIRGIKFSEILRQDTASVRKHYGKNLTIHSVDSVFNRTGSELTTFYVDDEKRFLPNVLISYFDGGTEVVIFELIISERALRPEAERTFINCIARFKALKQGTLGMR